MTHPLPAGLFIRIARLGRHVMNRLEARRLAMGINPENLQARASPVIHVTSFVIGACTGNECTRSDRIRAHPAGHRECVIPAAVDHVGSLDALCKTRGRLFHVLHGDRLTRTDGRLDIAGILFEGNVGMPMSCLPWPNELTCPAGSAEWSGHALVNTCGSWATSMNLIRATGPVFGP